MVEPRTATKQWTRPVDLKQQVQRLWDRGELLREILTCRDPSATGVLTSAPHNGPCENAAPPRFPCRLTLRKPASKELGAYFGEVREWIQQLQSMRQVRLVWREVRHPQLGSNSLPQEVWIDSLEQALDMIGKRSDAHVFASQVAAACACDQRLMAWIQRQPLQVLKLQHKWERLLLVYERMMQNPAPDIYIRQLGVPGVDTKFIEAHRKILGEWLELSMAPELINTARSGASAFAARYGFREKPARLRLRSLDSQSPIIGVTDNGMLDEASAGFMALADITLDVDVLAQLCPVHARILIMENEITYLSLPQLENTLAVFGAGYDLQKLANIPWMSAREVYCWGDIDRDGFAILNQLRAYLPQVRSVLMDRRTLLAHEPLFGTDPQTARRQLLRLTDEEQALYEDLLDDRLGERVRLEQEQVDFYYACQILQRL